MTVGFLAPSVVRVMEDNEEVRQVISRLLAADAKLTRTRVLVRKAHRLLLAHDHKSPSPGYPLEALELLRDALEDRP